MSRLREIRRILWWILILNLAVAAAKWGYGVVTHSLGMQADGLHSAFDGLSNVIGLIGLWLTAPPPDANHPYGHKKFEALTAGSIGGFLVMTCVYLLWKAYQSWAFDVHPQVTGISFVHHDRNHGGQYFRDPMGAAKRHRTQKRHSHSRLLSHRE